MAALDQDILQQLKQLNQTMGRLVGPSMGTRIDATDRNRKKNDDFTKSARDLGESYEAASKSLMSQSKSLKDIRSSYDKWSKAVDETGGYLTAGAKTFTHFSDNIFTAAIQAKKLVNGMGQYTDKLAKSTKAQSLLYENQLRTISGMEDFVKEAALSKFTDSLGALSDGAKKALGVFDETTGKIRTDLDFEDIARKRAQLGNVLADAAQNLAGTKFSLKDIIKDPSKFLASGDKMTYENGHAEHKSSDNQNAMLKMAAQLEKAGLIHPDAHLSVHTRDAQGNITGMKGESDLHDIANNRGAELLKTIIDALKEFQATVRKTDDTLDAMKTPAGRFIIGLQGADKWSRLFAKGLGYFMESGALEKAKHGLMDFYKELTAFNVAQIPQTYADTWMASAKLGMSFEDTTKLMQNNKRMLAIYGPAEFGKYMGNLKGTFEKFGYNMQQAAEIIQPVGEAAQTAGVNLRDVGAMQKYTDDTMKSFQKLAGVVNISAKEYAQLNSDLFKSDGVFQNLMGMDAQRSQAYAREMTQMRDELAVRGISIQQAQEIVQLNEQQKREKVSSRFTDAAKLLVNAQMSGMSQDDAQQLYQLTIKGRGRSGAESKQWESLMGQLGTASEQTVQGAYDQSTGQGLAVQSAFDNNELSGSTRSMMDKMMGVSAADRAGAGATPDEQARAASLAAGSQSGAAFGNVVNQITTVLKSALLGAITGSAAGLGYLAFNAFSAAKALGMLSGGANMGGLLDKFGGNGNGGFRGKGGFKAGIKGVGMGLGGLLGGMALSAGSDYAESQGYSKTGAGLDIASDALSMGSTGAMLGSFAGPVGTVVGGALGAATGAGYGLYKNWDGLFGTPTASSGPSVQMPGSDQEALPDTINTTSASGGPLAVKDASVTSQLTQLAALTTQMVQLLQKISDSDGSKIGEAVAAAQAATKIGSSVVTQSVPSGYAYTTGRV